MIRLKFHLTKTLNNFLELDESSNNSTHIFIQVCIVNVPLQMDCPSKKIENFLFSDKILTKLKKSKTPPTKNMYVRKLSNVENLKLEKLYLFL